MNPTLDTARRLRRALLAGPLAFVAVFFAWPLATILGRGVRGGVWGRTLGDADLWRVIWFTLWQAVVSAGLTVVVGLAPAHLLARRRFPGRRAMATLVAVPFVLPTVVSGAAFLAILPHGLHRTAAGMIVAHVWVNLALVVRGVSAAWAQLDPDLGAAAATLGAPPREVFRLVTLPLLRPAIAGAAALSFLFCVTSFGIARLVGGPANPTVEVEIWRRATQSFDLAGAATLAIVQLTLVIAVLLRWRPSAVTLRPRSTARQPLQGVDRFVLAGTALVLGAPLVALVVRSLRVAPGQWGFSAWRALIDPPRVGTGSAATALVERPLATLLASLATAAVAAVIAVGFGVAAAVGLARAGRRVERFVGSGLTVPLAASAVTVGLGMLITFDDGWYDLRSSWILVPLGQAVVALPVVLRLVGPVVQAIPADLRAAAAVLGASPWRVARAVDLGVALRAITAASGFAVAVSLGEFGATSLLTRTGSPTAPIAIVRLLARPSPFQIAQASALAVALGALVVVLVALVDRREGSVL